MTVVLRHNDIDRVISPCDKRDRAFEPTRSIRIGLGHPKDTDPSAQLACLVNAVFHADFPQRQGKLNEFRPEPQIPSLRIGHDGVKAGKVTRSS